MDSKQFKLLFITASFSFVPASHHSSTGYVIAPCLSVTSGCYVKTDEWSGVH